MMQSAYLCIILHVKHKKLPFIAVLTRFLIIGKIQDGGHCWRHHRLPAAPPPNKIYLFLLRRSKAFHWRQNRFEILQHIKNAGEGFYQPPLPLYHGGGMNLRVRPRVKRAANRGTYNQQFHEKGCFGGWCRLSKNSFWSLCFFAVRILARCNFFSFVFGVLKGFVFSLNPPTPPLTK